MEQQVTIERKIVTFLVSLSDFDFDAAVRRGKVALLAAALGLNSRALIKRARQVRANLAAIGY